MKAFDRHAILTVDTIRVDSSGKQIGTGGAPTGGLRFDFSVTKTLKPEPNKATINVYNLSLAHRLQLQAMRFPSVQLEAGYAETLGVIFLGKLRDAGTTKKEDGSMVTVLESGDGEKELKSSRVNVSIAKGTNTDQILKQIAGAIGVGKGNLDDAARKIRSAFSGTANIFSSGTVLSGLAAREMDRICKSLRLEWSVQGGKLQILERNKALEAVAIKLNKKTGMKGEPTIDNKGFVTAQAVLMSDLVPGRIVVIEGDRVKGQFRVEETTHSGDTYEGEWMVEMKGKPY